MMLVTATLLPPSCDAIDPQKFSAAVTWILPSAAAGLADDPDPHAAAATTTSSSAAPTAARRFPGLGVIGGPSGSVYWKSFPIDHPNPQAFPLQLQWIRGPLPHPGRQAPPGLLASAAADDTPAVAPGPAPLPAHPNRHAR